MVDYTDCALYNFKRARVLARTAVQRNYFPTVLCPVTSYF